MMMRLLLLALLVAVTVAVPTNQKDGNDGDVMKMLKEMQVKIAQLDAKDEVLKEEVLQLKAENKAMRDQKQLEGNVDSLFLATFSEEYHSISDNGIMVFDTALVNPGGHYDTETGAYTAPYNGYYQFSVTKRGNEDRAHFWLLVDGQQFLYNDLYTSDATAPSGTTTINIELTAGQTVRVQNNWSTVIYGTDSIGTIHSWFTGFLLYLQ